MMPTLNDFELELIRPSQSCLLTVTWIEVEALNSSFTLGHDHLPVVAILKPGGTLRYSPLDENIVTITVSSGIFNFAQGRAVILLDH